MLQLILTEKIGELGVSAKKEIMWQKYLTEEGKKIAFWGAFGAANLNLTKLKNQLLPVMVTLHDSECCDAGSWQKKQYDIDWSVPETCFIDVEG